MPGYYFNLPQITDLTISQQSALGATRCFALSGGPGTGKSVVSLFRHITNYSENNKKSLLLTYTTTLQCYLQACCRSRNTRAAGAVRTSLRGKPKSNESWDEIIVDEAQDLPADYYASLPSSKVSYGADDGQQLYPRNCTQAELRRIFSNNEEFTLDRNFRNSRRILEFCKRAFPQARISDRDIAQCRVIGEKPTLINRGGTIYEKTNLSQNNAITQIIRNLRSDTHNIAILVPWQTQVDIFREVLNQNGISHTWYKSENYNDTGCTDISNVHITTFKSAKGLEFDTVIIPNFHNYPSSCGQFNVEWQDFYVACTRARSNLYLISANSHSNLRDVVDVE